MRFVLHWYGFCVLGLCLGAKNQFAATLVWSLVSLAFLLFTHAHWSSRQNCVFFSCSMHLICFIYFCFIYFTECKQLWFRHVGVTKALEAAFFASQDLKLKTLPNRWRFSVTAWHYVDAFIVQRNLFFFRLTAFYVYVQEETSAYASSW